jgi:hypothetical protein
MSYCRWSSDSWKSDLYVYEDVSGGWTIHVAGNRIIGDVPPLDYSTAEKLGETYRAQMAVLKDLGRAPIGLPQDGCTFHLASPGECADRIEDLAAIGYHVPPGVVEALRAEQAELDA